MVKSRRRASCSGVPKTLSRRISRSPRLGRGAVVVVVLHLPRVGAEGGSLDDLRAEEDVGQPKTAADDPGVVKAAFDLLRGGAGDDVEVLRLEAEQEIAHAAAHQVRGVPGVFQPPDDVGRVGIDSIQGDVHCA